MTFMAEPLPAPLYSIANKKIFVAGHTGMVGSAILRRLKSEDCTVLTIGHAALDLTRQAPTEAFIEQHRPDIIIVAAARVGGILANSQYPAEFLYDNLAIGINIIRAAHLCGVERLLWLGSSCIYPREAPQPMTEKALLTGPLEPTNEAYAIAKIAALKYAEACARQFGHHFMTAMPTNLYGPNDNFDPLTSHVLPALMRRIHEAKLAGKDQVTLWGSGTPLREFLHVDDLADALIHLLRFSDRLEPVNIGTGDEVSIGELARIIAKVVGFEGRLEHDLSKPDGTPRKLLDTTHMRALGWRPRIDLSDGIREVYRNWLLEQARYAAA
ncbi:GDP-L-fucose synthase family protein [Brucella pseudogrignonensis]|jgi:GDP-L-fucose synthase|nr:GDP-L-fucose synthase [Brucella pseudogrignonensis]MBO1027339.1 GDP-L-fucose synthase [Ochrobactrum sp. SD129]MQP42807.1 NAD-dependent epimerase/dehydratase family protein [Ochrobactrum sp. MYb237]PQZ39068.1 GDP-L-fucose synthase [Brucella pseudogrignonensis]PRA35373.1 GDP-L-fucose synthase [Brucella pseudogrignonensis]PRA61104.1 GDP-L-fucose synthase [Brucella pseudogrignonensis]